MPQPRQFVLKQHYRAIDLEGVIEPGVYRENDPRVEGRAEYLVSSGRAEWVKGESLVEVSFFAGTPDPVPPVPPTPSTEGTETPPPPPIDRAVYSGLNKAQLMELGETNGVTLSKGFTNDEMIDALIIKRIVPEA